MLISIRFTKTGCCSAIGNFEPGDVARVSEGMARHLVDEAMVANYDRQSPVVSAQAVAQAEAVVESEAKRKPGRPRKI